MYSRRPEGQQRRGGEEHRHGGTKCGCGHDVEERDNPAVVGGRRRRHGRTARRTPWPDCAARPGDQALTTRRALEGCSSAAITTACSSAHLPPPSPPPARARARTHAVGNATGHQLVRHVRRKHGARRGQGRLRDSDCAEGECETGNGGTSPGCNTTAAAAEQSKQRRDVLGRSFLLFNVVPPPLLRTRLFPTKNATPTHQVARSAQSWASHVPRKIPHAL
jgi:hypothetical protein